MKGPNPTEPEEFRGRKPYTKGSAFRCLHGRELRDHTGNSFTDRIGNNETTYSVESLGSFNSSVS